MIFNILTLGSLLGALIQVSGFIASVLVICRDQRRRKALRILVFFGLAGLYLFLGYFPFFIAVGVCAKVGAHGATFGALLLLLGLIISFLVGWIPYVFWRHPRGFFPPASLYLFAIPVLLWLVNYFTKAGHCGF